MLPSIRLIIIVLGAAPIFLAGSFYEPFVAIGVLYLLCLGLCAVIDALLLPSRKCIVVERIAPGRISLAVPTVMSFRVRNNSRRGVELRIAERLGPTLEAQPELCVGLLEPGAERSLVYHLVARQRGRFELDEVDIRVLPVMGLLCRQFTLRLPAELHVFPNLSNIQRYELALRRGLPYEQGKARIRRAGHGYEFESLRYYSTGDDVSRIDWKTTAKRSRLVVKNYEPERQQSVLVALDVGRATAGEFGGISRLDYFINAALMLAYVSLRQGDWFSLVAFSNRIESYLPPVRHLKSVERVAQALYRLQPRLIESDYGLACRFLGLKNRKRSLICLMTDVIDRHANADIIAYMARFARQHLTVSVTLTNPEVRAVAEQALVHCRDPWSKGVALDVLAARQEALVAMRRHGVGILDAEPDQLTVDLINRYLEIKAARQL